MRAKNTKQRISFRQVKSISNAVVKWFEREQRALPWREDPSPYRVWISEIMAQQTRIETVLPYFSRFIKRFPDVNALADASLDEVLSMWSGLGYYSRAQNLHKAAKIIVERHGSGLPRDIKSLRALPGIGRYTAGAIASIAFDIPEPVLDGNIMRVLSRIFDLGGDIRSSHIRGRLWDIASAMIPQKNSRSFNQGLMELGALICTPKSPKCRECPVRFHCLSSARGTIADRPVKTARKASPIIYLIVAVIYRKDGALLLAQNDYKKLFGGLWLFPQIQIEKSELEKSSKNDLAKHFENHIGVRLSIRKKIGSIRHVLTHRKLILTLYECSIRDEKQFNPSGYRSFRWVKNSRGLDGLGLAAITKKMLVKIGFLPSE